MLEGSQNRMDNFSSFQSLIFLLCSFGALTRKALVVPCEIGKVFAGLS
jgi:hypothetical protein